MTNNDSDPLRRTYARNSLIAELLAYLILVGLAVDIAAVLILEKEWLEAVLSISADTLIFLGVWGELHFEGIARTAGDGIVAEARARAAEAELKLEQLRLEISIREALVADALRANAETGRLTALANTANMVTAQLLAWSNGAITQEFMSDAAKPFLIIQKVAPFAGTQFDAAVTSKDINREALLGSLKSALKAAGWTEVDSIQQSGDADRASLRGVRIDVDGSEDPTLLDAANALASALNAEGIATAVNQKPEIDIASANVIHVLVGPKAE